MCLFLSENKTSKLKRKWKKEGVECIVGWKIYTVSNKKCTSYYRIDNKIDLSRNDVISDRKSKSLTLRERQSEQVYQGIHVFLEKPESCYFNRRTERVVKVLCNTEDFVGCNAGYNNKTEAVFTKVFLEDGSWKELRRECGYLHP